MNELIILFGLSENPSEYRILGVLITKKRKGKYKTRNNLRDKSFIELLSIFMAISIMDL